MLKRGPRPKLIGDKLEEARRRHLNGESVRAIAAALETPRSTVARALADAGARRPTKSATSRTPRQALYRMIRLGKIPNADALPCIDCNHKRSAGDPRHEWAMTAKAEGGWKVSPVCVRCHRRRKRLARAVAYRARMSAQNSGQQNSGQRNSDLPGGHLGPENPGHANSDVARETSEASDR